ncbi:hypothetical protein Fcan01_17186 [Folsomia candida]|uniref:Gustatory receptor n=1 Tax=Folsomia candida TaxID=158441 RepID=A0A226DTH5_FOLCA|nr:hypothetical protein Fcan01_17186 [Folsomia candida]
MASNPVSSSFLEHSTKFGWFYSQPRIQWHNGKNCLVYKTRHKRTLLWDLDMFLAVDICGLSSFGYLLVKNIFCRNGNTDTIRLIHSLMILFFGMLNIHGVWLHVMTAFYGEDAVKGWNGLRRLEQDESSDKSSKPTSDRNLSLILTLIVRMFAVYPFLQIPSELFMNFDPYFYVIQDLRIFLNLCFGQTLILHFFRLIILTVTIYEISRVFALLILIFISTLAILARLNSALVQKFANTRQIFDSMRTMEFVTLNLQLFAPFQELGTFAVMSVGLVLFVIANFVTIALTRLPFPVYIFFPSVSVITGAIINATIPLAQAVHENSIEMLRNWGLTRLNLGQDAKLLRRKIRSARSLRLNVGLADFRMFYFNQETKVRYFEAVITYTLTMLLGLREG